MRKQGDVVHLPDGDEIVCDHCIQDVIGDVYVYRYAKPGHCTGSDVAYCQRCAAKHLLPYCK
jgi:hypothetical protein